MDNYLKRNNSLVVDTLAGQYRSEIRCPDCQRLSITFDPFLSLTLQFPRPDKGIELKGWFMTEQGEFQSMAVEVRSAMSTHEFYSKFFFTPVYGIYQREKRVSDVWDPALTVFQNHKPKGILFFFEKHHGQSVEVQFEINSPGRKDAENLVRVVFAKAIDNLQQLLCMALLAIRKPLEKAIGKDYNTEDYLSLNA